MSAEPVTTSKLSWPGKELPAVLTESGWVHIEPYNGLDFGFDPPLIDLPESGAMAVVLQGDRLAALRGLQEAAPGELALAYIDIPRLTHAPYTCEQLKVSTWLSALRSHASAVVPLLKPEGRIVAHIDDEGVALAMLVLDELLGRESRETTVMWEKKYGPLSISGKLVDAQDYLLVYRVGTGSPATKPTSSWWPWEYAGKSEDGTREAEQLRQSGIIALPEIPKTSKPAKLIQRILETYTAPGDLVLECFSDTAFASAAAISNERIPILLSGETSSERELLEKCAVPRLTHLVGNSGSIAHFRLNPQSYKQVSPSTGGGITLSVPTSDSTRPNQLRPIILHATGVEPSPATRGGFPPMAVEGETIDVLTALEPAVRCGVALALLDWTHHAPSPEKMRHQMVATTRLLSEEGVVAIAVEQRDYATARIIGQLDAFGKDHYLGTIALEPISGQQPILYLLFKGLPQARLGKIGLPADHTFDVPDGDPRGPWRDPGHKGARSGGTNTAFDFRFPPYRWELVGGELPPGVWRLNPITGIIWSPRLEKSGTYRFTVRVTDEAGQASESECTIAVKDNGVPTYPENVWWMERPATASDSPPSILNELPEGVVGERYTAVLEARGGQPRVGTTAPGVPTGPDRRTRYWEFSRSTLVNALLEDKVLFGKNGRARPRIKDYPDDEKTKVELSWWDRDRLGDQTPISRLISMFTIEGDLILLDSPSECRQVLTSGRRCVVVGGHDLRSSPVPFIGRLGEVIAEWDPARRAFQPNYESSDFEEGFPWIQGFIPPRAYLGDLPENIDDLSGVSPDGAEALVILRPRDWPTRQRCEDLAARFSRHFRKVYVHYYRGNPPKRLAPLIFRRIPFDITGAGT